MRMDYQWRKYAFLNKGIEVERHFRRVQRFLQPCGADRILEVGCGRGFLTRRVRHLAPATVGIDLNREAIANAVVGGLRVMDATQLAFSDASFDKVYSFHVIEHIPNIRRAFTEIDRVLEPGGLALLVYPAEPIRGLYVVPTALRVFGNPLRARDLHVHKLSPRRLDRYLAGTSLRAEGSVLHFLITPQFITLLRKDTAVRRVAEAV